MLPVYLVRVRRGLAVGFVVVLLDDLIAVEWQHLERVHRDENGTHTGVDGVQTEDNGQVVRRNFSASSRPLTGNACRCSRG